MFFNMRPSRNPGMAIPEGFYEKTAVYGFNRGTAFTYVLAFSYIFGLLISTRYSIVQTITLIVFVAMPHEQAWILMNWMTTKIYVNSILAMSVDSLSCASKVAILIGWHS